ncbi:MAG: threonine aldolase family protein, partial [Gemmatimonadetes bacterium]|nr:threonine aldolase family protein [Gemmatimonadota bacterium]
MRKAMAEAPVGDDVYGDDPTVRQLEEAVARLLGMEEAVFMPTGSMTNQVAIRCHTEPGDRILLDGTSHVVRSEGGGPAALSGVTHQPIDGERGVFTPTQVVEALGELHVFNPSALQPRATLLCVENTHNGGGGRVWPLEALREVVGVAHQRGLATHMDGARIWNACAASGIEPRAYAEGFDTVSVCFSKGLGAPVGSALAGTGRLMDRARRFKQLFGGGFRQ